MAQHLIWTAGLIGHLLLVAVLLGRRAARRFPLFTLLIVYDILRALALAFVPGHLSRSALLAASTAFDVADLTLEYGVLAELVFLALGPLGGFRRATLSLLLLASGILVLIRVAPVSRHPGRIAPLLLHFLLEVLMLEWAVVLAVLLRPLRIRWRSEVAVISFGFGVYAVALIFGGGYFRVGRDMSDYVFFSYLRIFVYLFVVLWWIVALWMGAGGRKSSRQGLVHARG